MSVGGSIVELSLDGRTFSVAADADPNRKLGGYENEVQANGDGTARVLKTVVPFAISDISISIDDSIGDQEYIQDLSNRNSFFPITITLASGAVYVGTGQIVGELTKSEANATMGIGVAGQAKLVKQ